jgi:hypothetical protein
MKTDDSKLTLRQQSIRALTASELKGAHGGDGGQPGGTVSCAGSSPTHKTK